MSQTPSRYMGIAKSWLPNKHHSYVSIISNEKSGMLKVEFQNERFETMVAELNPEELIKKAGYSEFMGI